MTTENATTPDAPPPAGNDDDVGLRPDGTFVARVGGKPYRLRPSTFADQRAKEELILAARPSLAEKLVEASAVPEEFRQRAIDQVFAKHELGLRFSTFAETAAFDHSPMGVCFGFWRAVRHDHPEVDGMEAAARILDSLTADESVVLLTALGIV